MTLRKFAGLGALLSLISPSIAMAHEASFDSRDTQWALTAASLMPLMMIRGIASPGGMVRSRNIPSVTVRRFASTVVYAAIVIANFKIIDTVMGLRGSQEEAVNLATGPYNQRGYNL
jgi:ammonia channel protein AmtB